MRTKAPSRTDIVIWKGEVLKYVKNLKSQIVFKRLKRIRKNKLTCRENGWRLVAEQFEVVYFQSEK